MLTKYAWLCTFILLVIVPSPAVPRKRPLSHATGLAEAARSSHACVSSHVRCQCAHQRPQRSAQLSAQAHAEAAALTGDEALTARAKELAKELLALCQDDGGFGAHAVVVLAQLGRDAHSCVRLRNRDDFHYAWVKVVAPAVAVSLPVIRVC